MVRMPGRFRVLALSDAAERRAAAVRDRHPDLPIEIVRISAGSFGYGRKE